ncbi:MAG: bifunctional shikimate kinase/3-dehydroquinate synthase [Thermoleophilaceae bacterium]|nr:bifunctional shikimate kinase/3-dehydroquinate synthase [Thermoleophilaceae bacterium]
MEALNRDTAERRPRGPGRRGGALVLIGFMGAGKTSAARTMAAELGTGHHDSDREIERELGEPIEAFFDREGEEAFRAREEETILRLLADESVRVLALGGGALGSARVREALADHLVVLLEVEPGVAWHRASGKGRPLARDRGRFEQLHGDRQPLYESLADAILPAGDRGLPRRALPAIEALREAPEGTRLVWASAESGEYPVFVGKGLLAAGFFHPRDARRFVVTDENVARHHRVEGEWQETIPPGEAEKTLARAEEVLRGLARAGCERGDLVAAVGGGVVGDLAGFCAAVYQRGVRHVQVPTSLVAQVDSAYGGKTGVDLPEGKNYVGAFHQPSAVIADPAALETLPREELAAGYAEVVKTALIAGGELWARVRSGAEVDERTILGCLRTKLRVVSEDERDDGRRQVLNLGHTIAHALESATGYRRYRHGEAVAIGLLAALRLSGREDLRNEVAELLRARGLPERFDGAAPEQVAELIGRDKKSRGGRVGFVLVDAPGQVSHGHKLDDGEVLAAIRELAG